MTTAIVQTFLHTPVWVWGLLALVLWLGWRGLQVQTVAPVRLAILPAVAVSVSLFNAMSTAHPALSVPAWLLAACLAAPLGGLIAARRGLSVASGQGQLQLAGSWFPMALGLSIFVVRYAMGVAVGRQPSLAADLTWIVAAAAIGGAIAGIGLGWLARLLLRYRRALRTGRVMEAA
ncbi:DUF6622 family protein [Vineibacter terrae]|uniref:DUF6622 family protein n=1 Tax=Vineibacter terrae TaxID=2586908 RepID=UPI0015B6672C|nr:DUF6622 family protein [Vineibacter terrae]